MMPLPECSVLWLTSRGEQGIDAVDARHGLRVEWEAGSDPLPSSLSRRIFFSGVAK
jgi:hypothetical protein